MNHERDLRRDITGVGRYITGAVNKIMTSHSGVKLKAGYLISSYPKMLANGLSRD